MQIPYHDPYAVINLVDFIRDFQPDMLVNVGDDIDSPEVSHWNKGAAGEYAGTLQASLDTLKDTHGLFRDALGDKPYHVSRSNHGDRVRKYVSQYAPALKGLRSLDENELFGYRELGIEYHRQPFPVAPGWYCAHGDEGTLSSIGGRTAALLAQKWGVSVVCGHTHRAGIISKTYSVNSQITAEITGMEVGHLMDMGQAGYLPAGSADWQQAFGLLYVSGDRVSPVLVPVSAGGRFTVEGVSYG
jgi:hypothetical protein